MKTYPLLLRTLLALVLSLCGGQVFAQSCTITANNLASGNNYNPFVAGFNDTMGIFSITCTRPRSLQNRFPSVFYVGADNGLYFLSGSRRLQNGTAFLNYALYRNAACSQAWGTTTATAYALNNSATGPNNTTTTPNPLTGGTTYCFRITGGVNTAIPGTYTDTVQVGIADSNGTVWGTKALTLTTTVVASCNVISPPTAVTLTYTSFQASAPSAVRPFQMRCTNTTSYSLGFDAPVVGTNDKVQGLNYDLSTSAATGTGNGLTQSYNVTVAIPAGQAGTCVGPGGSACTGTVTRAVTVTY